MSHLKEDAGAWRSRHGSPFHFPESSVVHSVVDRCSACCSASFLPLVTAGRPVAVLEAAFQVVVVDMGAIENSWVAFVLGTFVDTSSTVVVVVDLVARLEEVAVAADGVVRLPVRPFRGFVFVAERRPHLRSRGQETEDWLLAEAWEAFGHGEQEVDRGLEADQQA